MSSSANEMEEPSSSDDVLKNGASKSAGEAGSSEEPRPPAKRPLSTAVIEISDTESDDSDICAVTSYQASADEVKRIRGADYSSSSSSSSDYSSDSESPWEDDSIIIPDEKVHVKLPRPQLNTRASRTDEPRINTKILASELIDNISEYWRDSKEYSSDEVTLICEPFRVCLLHDLLANVEIINNIVDDMNTLDWNRKKMDLYEFHQTADLASLTWQRSIRGIYELLKTDVMGWVSKVTGLELSSVSASCSLYGPGDHLLVHDDLLGDRRVAFILYLAPWKPRVKHDQPIEINGAGDHDIKPELAAHGWATHMGGALELLGRDQQGAPERVLRALYPRNNMMALFQVTPHSYHQVGEVLSLELPRLSINGWFHGPAPPHPDPTPPRDSAPLDLIKPNNDVVILNQWLESSYMSPRNRIQIQQQMERDSEVCLREFLLPDKVQEVLRALEDEATPWERAGPADQRRYLRLPGSYSASLGAAHPLRALLRMTSSATWVTLLADLADLALTHCAALELQKWAAADFTLLPPRERYQQARLEAVYYLAPGAGAGAGAPGAGGGGGGGAGGGGGGGATTYVAPEEAAGGALVVVPPRHNALSLVYCDAGAASFTKYLSKITTKPHHHFYILTCTYYE